MLLVTKKKLSRLEGCWSTIIASTGFNNKELYK